MPDNSPQGIHFFSEDCSFTPGHKTDLRNWLYICAKREKNTIGELNYIFCSDRYLRKLNKKFLEHDYFTDVITFPSSFDNTISGDIFLSIDRIRDNAKTYGVRVYEEMCRVMVHGLLHISGYNDKTEKDQKHMRKLEDKYLRLFQ